MLKPEIIGANPRLIYDNPLEKEENVRGFVLEGQAKISFPSGRMRMENMVSAEEGQKANYVYWCPETFPDNVLISWDFWPIREPGLCILFFAARGRNGEDLFDPALRPRTGEYKMYHHGDISAFHVSYFRRKELDERGFHVANLRKSYGFHIVAQGGDPIPDVVDCINPYHIDVLKKDNVIKFYINELEVFTFHDDGLTYGPLLGEGKIGFRQLAPFIGEYSNLKVYALEGDESQELIVEKVTQMIHSSGGYTTLAECAEALDYHPSYLWKVLKRKTGITFTDMVIEEKLKIAKDMLLDTDASIAEVADALNYSNSQNFIRFFTKYCMVTPGQYRKQHGRENI